MPFTDGEIKDSKKEYYRKEDDRLLYDALVKQLEEYEGNAEKAFAEPFYKPRSDGTKGSVVKKVKMLTTQSNGVYVNNGKGIAANGDMVRIDIFCKKGEYYMVPIYVSDLVLEKLPNKAVAIRKPKSQWMEMEECEFLFSLYPYELVYMEDSKGNSFLGYYKNANSCNANIVAFSHDNREKTKPIEKGIKGLKKFMKYQVDMLGNLYRVEETSRQTINKRVKNGGYDGV